MKQAIAAEIRDLISRRTFKVVMRVELLPHANVPTAQFVLAIRHKITGEVRFRGRYAMRGHSDSLKAFLVHGSLTRQPARLHVHVVLSIIFNSKSGPLK